MSKRAVKPHRSTKNRQEARLLRPAGERLSLHGKEAVPGSSPGEDFKPPQRGGLFVVSLERIEHQPDKEGLDDGTATANPKLAGEW
jgi:hypothetical protein